MSEQAMWLVMAGAAGLSVGFGVGYVFGWVSRSERARVLDRIDREIAELDRQLAEMQDEDEVG